ncbi:hypothetical protein NDU88_001657 [Pleurodeles waltl]|uniref:Glycoprotein n=1 Tax=Pleurodeles waltl TaxID=8319 RepID=A0AAV7UUN7_PLEWA|nr:hypothetical protein NDU88_001657 [Pleurodeles waltl]
MQTLKYATGATAPVAPSHYAGSILSRRPRGKVDLPWAGGRPFGGRPPAQGKSQNTLSGLSTAERYFGGGTLAGGLRRPPKLESPPKCCKYVCVGLITTCVLIIVAIVLGMHGENERETNDASTSKTITELTPLKNLEQDKRHLHDKKELSSNVFYRLLSEYVETMDAKDCYVCTQIPTSVAEGVTYHSMPLTYGITCSLIMTRFYGQEYIHYFYSNQDVTFAYIPIIEYLSKVARDYYIKLMRGFFEPLSPFHTAHAHRENLICLLSPMEISFLDRTDDRRKAVKEKLERELHKRTSVDNYAFAAIKTQGKIALDTLHIGRFCVHRHKSYYDTVFVGTSECKDTFLFQPKWTFMLNGQDPVIPGIYYICGLNAYYRLPKGWYGRCYLGIVFPKVYQLDDLKKFPKLSESHHVQKRETASGVVGDIFGVVIPSVGVILNSIKIRKLSTIVDNMLTKFSGAIILMDAELAAERAMTLQNRLALDILLAKDGGVCKMLGTRHCCTYIPDNSGQIRKMLTNLTNESADLKELKEPGVWEKVGKGFASVGNWLSNIWNGLLLKIVKGILIVLICLLGIWGIWKAIKILKTRNKRRREEKIENKMVEIYIEKSKGTKRKRELTEVPNY